MRMNEESKTGRLITKFKGWLRPRHYIITTHYDDTTGCYCSLVDGVEFCKTDIGGKDLEFEKSLCARDCCLFE